MAISDLQNYLQVRRSVYSMLSAGFFFLKTENHVGTYYFGNNFGRPYWWIGCRNALRLPRQKTCFGSCRCHLHWRCYWSSCLPYSMVNGMSSSFSLFQSFSKSSRLDVVSSLVLEWVSPHASHLYTYKNSHQLECVVEWLSSTS